MTLAAVRDSGEPVSGPNGVGYVSAGVNGVATSFATSLATPLVVARLRACKSAGLKRGEQKRRLGLPVVTVMVVPQVTQLRVAVMVGPRGVGRGVVRRCVAGGRASDTTARRWRPQSRCATGDLRPLRRASGRKRSPQPAMPVWEVRIAASDSVA